MKGICFIEPMFHATMEGWKTQTRRVIKPQPSEDGLWNDTLFPRSVDSNLTGFNGETEDGNSIGFKPKYQVGEILYLKEPYVFYEEKYLELKTTHGLEIAYKYGSKPPLSTKYTARAHGNRTPLFGCMSLNQLKISSSHDNSTQRQPLQ